MTKRAIGGYEFNYECSRIRNSTASIAESLTRIIETNPGPQTLYMLVARMAIENTNINNAIDNIEKIGRDNKRPAN